MHQKGSYGLLRNSYDFQNISSPAIAPSNHHPFKMANPLFSPIQVKKNKGPIQQLQNNIVGVEKEFNRRPQNIENNQRGNNPQKPLININYLRPKKHEEILPGKPFKVQGLRGSCSAIIQQFDYNTFKQGSNFYVPSQNFQQQSSSNNTQKVELQLPQRLRKSNMIISQNNNPTININFLNTLEIKTKSLLIHQKHTQKYQQIVLKLKASPVKQNMGQRNMSSSNFSVLTQENSINTEKSNQKNSEKLKFTSLNQVVETKRQDNKLTPRNLSKLLQGFQFGPTLGKGKFGQVYLARHSETGFLVAIKKVQKAKLVELKMIEQFIREIKLHSSFDNPNIVKFYGFFCEKEEIYLVMEYLNGGTLFDYLNEVNTLSLIQTVEFLRDIIQALNYMHGRSIAHRDIKPENIVVSSEGVAKLCDFGWSALVEHSRKTYCGTLDYAPPEIIQRKEYDLSVDIWSIGVLTYQLLIGRAPFESQQRKQVIQKIVNVHKDKIDYPPDFPSEAKEFIEALIQKDPTQRPKCSQLLNFALFKLHPPRSKTKKKSMN